MGKVTKISWATSSHNFWYGCQKVSPECAYCYAERWAKRTGRDFANVTRVKDFTAPLRWPEPKVIFTCSLSDFFVKEADTWRDEAWEVIRKAYWHTWLILSKRWDRVLANPDFIPWNKQRGGIWPNVWLGVSAGNQRMLKQRMEEMTYATGAAKTFLSAEPLLGDLGLGNYLYTRLQTGDGNYPLHKLDLVIVGGESGGPEHRALVYRNESSHVWDNGRVTYRPKPRALEWVRSIRDQCEAAGVAFHFKQWGGPKPDSAGAMLDGREWREFPA